MLCEAMKWNHLPEAGGLYDQNPQLIDRFYYLFAERSKAEAAEQRKREREHGGPTPRNARRVAGHRR